MKQAACVSGPGGNRSLYEGVQNKLKILDH